MPALPRHRRISPTTVAVVVTLVAGCSGTVPTTPAAEAPPTVDVLTSADIVGWDDGLAHLVVTTLPDADAPAAVSAPAPGPTDDLGTWRRVVDRPPTGLTSVPAATPAEIDALSVAGPDSEIVEDTKGLVGEPGRRYLRTLGSLFEVDPAGAPAPAPTGATASARGGFAELIAGLDGVVSAEPVGDGIVAVTAQPSAVADVTGRIEAIAGVADVDEDVLFGLTDDPRQGEQWALANTGSPAQADGHPGVAGVDVRAVQAWTVTEGAGTVVAVIDSGVDLAHPDLASAIWTNPGEQCGNGVDDDANGFVDDCRGWDFGDRDADPSPSVGSTGWYHGTHVAGIVAAQRNGTGTVGVAPRATILPIKVSDSAGRLSLASIAAAIDYAAAHADVINLSLGTSPGVPREYVTGLEAAVARAGAAGVTVVAAMGNDGVDISGRPVWPASYATFYDHVIAVGASTNSDAHASFSNTGSPLTLFAPGWAIMSTMPQSSWGYLYGTSMATPVVAGAAASVKATGLATAPAAIRSRLVATSVSAPVGRRLDLAAAVGYVAPTEQPAVSVTLFGADRAVADEPATLEWVVATRDVTTASVARMSVAARDAAGVGAVEGLDAVLTSPVGGAVDARTDDRGELPLVPVDGAALAAGGVSLTATVALPPAEYAFVVELLDAAGQPVAPPVATYLSVASPGGVATTTAPPTVPATTVPATTVPGAPGAPAPTTPATTPATTPGTTPGGGTPLWPTTTAVPGSPGSPPATQGPGASTTVPDRSVVTAPPAAPATTTSGATPGTTPGVPTPTTTPAVTPTTTPSPVPTTTAPGTPSSPATTTLPPPAPVRDGDYRATAISPRSGPMTGGTVVTIDGVFPASVPIYVWFGDSWSTAVRSAADTTRLTVTTPAASVAGVRDVVVRFATDRSVELRLANAFEFVAGGTPGTPPTVSPPTAAPGNPGGTGGSGGTGGAGSPATTVVAPVTPITTPATTTPATAVPTTVAPPATTIAATTVPAAAPTRPLGRLTLRQVPAGSALSAVAASPWPATGCRAASCTGTTL